MENYPSLDNLAAASFQPLGPGLHRQQHQQQQQQQHQQYQFQPQQSRIGQTGIAANKQHGAGHIPGLMFDIPALGSTGAETTTSVHAPALPAAPMGSVMNPNNYPLALDPTNLQGPASFTGLGGSGLNMDGTGQLSGVGSDDSAALSMPGAGAGPALPGSQLHMQALSSAGSNAGFISSPLPTPLSAIQNSTAMHQQAHAHTPQQPGGGMHSNMPLMPPARPYNMMFGVPGLSDGSVVYDDRMSMPAMHPGGGSWLRIRQPIDYVAPLKKPMNSFLLYSAERRVQLRQTHPDLNTTQQSTILAREWASLPEEEKEKYRAEAKQLRDDYNARRAELSLKLQQQLNQQHLGMSLGHPPPPPPPPHGAVHPPPQDLLGPDSQHSRLHSASTFGLQHTFNAPGAQLGHTQFSPLTPAGTHNQQQEDAYMHSQAVAGSVTGQLQFENALSALDPANGSHMHSLTVGRSTPQTFDIANSGLLPNIYDHRDSKWQELVTASSELRQDSGALSSQSYGALRSASSMSYSTQDQLGQPGISTHRQPGVDDADILTSGMLSTANSLFDNPFDSVFQAGALDNNIGSFSEADSRLVSQHAASCIGLTDVRTIPMGGLGPADHDSRPATANPETLQGMAD
ncbi:hypothetical protein IWW52_003534, partial [Coemansia sp. RSA 2704]